MKLFNTAGECHPEKHYMVPPEPRLPDARRLVEGHYFVVHAPCQTGKTTILVQLAKTLTAEGGTQLRTPPVRPAAPPRVASGMPSGPS